MSPSHYTPAKFEDHRNSEGWTRTGTFGSPAAAAAFLAGGHSSWKPFDPDVLRAVVAEATAQASAVRDDTGVNIVALDRSDTEGHLSLANRAAGLVVVWSFSVTAPDARWCLGRLAELARRSESGRHPDTPFTLAFVEQEDRAFMWRSPAVHPCRSARTHTRGSCSRPEEGTPRTGSTRSRRSLSGSLLTARPRRSH